MAPRKLPAQCVRQQRSRLFHQSPDANDRLSAHDSRERELRSRYGEYEVMDALKVLPQAFFDAIARVVPGLTVVFLLAWLEPKCWEKISEAIGKAMGSRSGDWSPWALPAIGFAIGHLLSPGAKFIQWLTDRYPQLREDTEEDQDECVRAKAAALLRSFLRLNKKDQRKRLKPNPKHYDWLRVKAGDAGGLAAKLRAEFTMYNTLGFVFSCWAIRLFSTQPYHQGLLMLSLALLMMARGRETQKTMRDCVERFYGAAGGP